MCRDRGASTIYMTDVNKDRLDVALGVVGRFVDDAWVTGEDDDGVQQVVSRTDGRGADRVSVAAPSKQAQESALEMAAKRARIVYFAGLPKHDPVSPLDMNQLHYKELAILGAYGATRRQYRITMDYLNRRRDELAAVVTHRFPLEAIAEAASVMPPGSYVLREAAGLLAVDFSNASSLALLDPRTRTWSAPILDAVGIDPGMLPELAPGTQPVGRVTRAFAEVTGLSPETVVVVGCGDEMAATLGAGVFAPWEVCDVVGTAEPVCAASAEPREDPTMLVECHPHADPDVWLLENPGFVSGGGLRWWRDHFAPLEREAEARGDGDAYD